MTQHGLVRGLLASLAVVASTAGVTGCTAETAPAPAPTFHVDDALLAAEQEGGLSGARSVAVDLAGMWQVSEAEGEAPGTYVGVWIGPERGSVDVYRDCGSIGFGMAASETAFLAQTNGGMGSCDIDTEVLRMGWLTDARGYRVVDDADGHAWELLDASGDVLARLDPAVGMPVLPGGISGTPVELPRAIEPERMLVAAPLASGLTAATAADLVGTWSPVGPVSAPPEPAMPIPSGAASNPGERASITFAADGRYRIDDCSTFADSDLDDGGSHLGWVGDGTDFLATDYPRFDIGCSPLWPRWESHSTTIALDHGYLRLFDRYGSEIGRLERVG